VGNLKWEEKRRNVSEKGRRGKVTRKLKLKSFKKAAKCCMKVQY
jgi:hypothetical protein